MDSQERDPLGQTQKESLCYTLQRRSRSNCSSEKANDLKRLMQNSWAISHALYWQEKQSLHFTENKRHMQTPARENLLAGNGILNFQIHSWRRGSATGQAYIAYPNQDSEISKNYGKTKSRHFRSKSFIFTAFQINSVKEMNLKKESHD